MVVYLLWVVADVLNNFFIVTVILLKMLSPKRNLKYIFE